MVILPWKKRLLPALLSLAVKRKKKESDVFRGFHGRLVRTKGKLGSPEDCAKNKI